MEAKFATPPTKIPGIVKIDLGKDKELIEQERRQLEIENAMLKTKLESLAEQHDKVSSPSGETRTPSLDPKVSVNRTSE